MTFTKMKPRKLTESERIDLRKIFTQALTDESFEKFVNLLELALGSYTHWCQHRQPSIPGAQARESCDEIRRSAEKLRFSWNKAPDEARQLLDVAYQLQKYENDISIEGDERAVYQPALSEVSAESGPFFESVEHVLGVVIETATLASASSDTEKKGGRLRDFPSYLLAHQIAHAFVDILEQRPTTTPTGPFSEVLHLAKQFVGDNAEPTDQSRFVRKAVEEIRKSGGQPEQELSKPSK